MCAHTKARHICTQLHAHTNTPHTHTRVHMVPYLQTAPHACMGTYTKPMHTCMPFTRMHTSHPPTRTTSAEDRNTQSPSDASYQRMRAEHTNKLNSILFSHAHSSSSAFVPLSRFPALESSCPVQRLVRGINKKANNKTLPSPSGPPVSLPLSQLDARLSLSWVCNPYPPGELWPCPPCHS